MWSDRLDTALYKKINFLPLIGALVVGGDNSCDVQAVSFCGMLYHFEVFISVK